MALAVQASLCRRSNGQLAVTLSIYSSRWMDHRIKIDQRSFYSSPPPWYPDADEGLAVQTIRRLCGLSSGCFCVTTVTPLPGLSRPPVVHVSVKPGYNGHHGVGIGGVPDPHFHA